MKAHRAALLSLVLCLSLFAALPASAAPPLPRGPEIRVNTRTSAHDHVKPAVAVFPGGGFVVAWATNSGNRARFFDNQGRPISGERALRVRGRISQIIADRNGFLVVAAVSTDSGVDVLLRRFHRNGTPQGPAIRANTASTHDWRPPIAAVGPNGLVGVAWAVERADSDPERGNHTSAMGRIFSVEGTPLTPEITLVEGDGASAAGDDRLDAFPVDLAFKPDGTMVALVQDHDHGGGCLQSLLVLVPSDGSGEPERHLGLGSVSCGPPEHLEASVTVGRDGSLLAAWSEHGIQARRFAPDETPGAAFFVSKDSVDSQLDPVSALQAGGNFVIVWTEEVRDGDGKGIFGRAFAANGTPRSGDFQIDLTTEGDQHKPAIAAARRGPVVVVWLQPNDQGGSDVFARVLAENR